MTDGEGGTNNTASENDAARFIKMDLSLIEQTIEQNELKSALEAEQLIRELDELKVKYDETLMSMTDDESFRLRLEFSRKIDAKANLLLYISENKSKANHQGSSTGLLKLPALDVGTFSGEITKWSSFKGNFLTIINDSRVKDHDEVKRQFLFKAIKGEALALIENLQDASFDQGWEILCENYDDPLRRAKAHFDALSDQKNSKQSLRRRLIDFRRHSSGLQAAYRDSDLDPFDQIVIA